MQSRRKPPLCQTIMFATSAAYSKDNRDLDSRKRPAGNKNRFSSAPASLSKAFHCGGEMQKKKEKHNLPAQSLEEGGEAALLQHIYVCICVCVDTYMCMCVCVCVYLV